MVMFPTLSIYESRVAKLYLIIRYVRDQSEILSFTWPNLMASNRPIIYPIMHCEWRPTRYFYMAQLATDLKVSCIGILFKLYLWDILQIVFYAIKGTCWYFPD